MKMAASPETRGKECCMSVFTNAVNELLRLQGKLDSRLRTPGGDVFFGPSAPGVYPPVNVFRDPNGNVVIRAELPGLTPEGITVSCRSEEHPSELESHS